MEGRFDWHEPTHWEGRESFLPAPDRVGSWMVISLLGAIILHVILFISLGHIKLGFGWTLPEEVVTAPVMVRPVEDDSPIDEAPDDSIVPVPEPDRSKLVDDIEILEQLKDPELEMKPEISEASFNVDIKIEAPALAGDPAGDTIDVASAVDISPEDLESLGKTETFTNSVADGQIIVDPGSDLAKADPLDSFMRDLIKKGSDGKAVDGKLDGTSSLDEIAGLPENVLVTKTTMLPGDLLFEYNSSQLRDSSKIGMQKIALVMDLNPQLYCWIEGHTDLFGGDEFNYELALRRAESVKSYLVGIGMDPDKIKTRGIGKGQPIVLEGDQEQQSINRRVEIKMRKSPPPANLPRRPMPEPPPLKALPVPPAPNPEAPKPEAIRVKPLRAIPVPEEPMVEPPAPPRAIPIEEDEEVAEQPEQPLRAIPVEERPPLRAIPIDE